MRLRNYWNLLTGKSKALKPATLSFKNIKAVIQSYFRKAKVISGFSLPSHIYEQIIWRRTQVMEKSPECWNNNECKVCGCDVLGKTMEDRACSAKDIDQEICYPAMMEKQEWLVYKEDKKIKLFD